ncbi:hypothetical protein [Spirosoma endbachense]|uniref:Outer membrane beta-barrel protein n=1 Tax=Spirosoma endbachense TaxID=2666025 RepID=A0A6P1VZH7_9BACT|nr:hypothetical protein [Spirosoma endbachense]QHV97180.1 hypothetical protein GJR95_20180 [Spirosoma endbachense]
MKTTLLLLLVSLSIASRAQPISQQVHTKPGVNPFTRKSWQIGIQGGYSKAEFISRNSTIQLYGGYFVANKLSMGLSGTWVAEWTRNVLHENTLTIGPAIRYQLTQTRISPFLAASYQIGARTLTIANVTVNPAAVVTVITTPTGSYTTISGSNFTYSSSNKPTAIHSRSLTAGISVGVVSSMRVDVALNWQGNAFPAYPEVKRELFQLQFGLNYQPGATYRYSLRRKPIH